MEENVALESSKQKKFVKSIKGIKKLIKKTADDPENVEPKSKDVKKSKRKRPERGLVYLSHIPHGFYEHQMTQYFKQFGAVSNVRVIRSKRTGNSKGFAFVEFKQPAVAEIVAETMNNYLMGKRLIKAAYVPPEKQKPRAMRKHWSRLNNPGRDERLKQKKAYNADKDKEAELKKAQKTISNFNRNMKKLSELGINYDFFTPVDIPEGMSVGASDSQKIKDGSSSKKESKQKKDKEIKEVKAVTEVKVSKLSKKEKTKPEPVVNKKEQSKKQQKLKDAGVKLPENFIKINEQDEDRDDSADFDSDDYNKMLESDSDAESEDESGEEETGEDSDEEDGESEESGPGEEDEFEITGSDDDESDGEDESDEEILPPPKKGKSKGPVIPQPVQTKKENKPQGKQQKGVVVAQKGIKGPVQEKGPKGLVQQKGPKGPVQQKGPKGPVQQKGPKGPVQQKGPIAPEQNKRKAPQKNAVQSSPKKPKFEKQTQQPLGKQFKKKK